MKIILLGNAGSGKSSLAKKLIARQSAVRLSLDEVAFKGGAERHPIQDSIADVKHFITNNDNWVIEGCYSDIIEPILEDCDELIFLNPGIDICIAHCRSRPWEPDKFGSKREQDKHLENLVEWVRSYETRSDEYGLQRHRALYESFNRKKCELKYLSEYDSIYDKS